MTNQITPIVSIKNDIIVCNSRDVADYFGKRHDNVLQSISSLLLKIQEQAMFFETKVAGRTGMGIRNYRAFDMTKDGFTLLAMGFTGDKALDFKLAYIDQFNAMEQQLKAQAAPVPAFTLPTSFAEALRLAADQAEKIGQLEQEITVIKPVIEEVTMQSWAGQSYIHLNPSQTSRLSWAIRRIYDDRNMGEVRRVPVVVNLGNGKTVDQMVKVYQPPIIDEAARSLGLI